MNKNIPIVVGITILFLGTCITPTVATDTIEQTSMPTSDGKTLYVGGTGPDNYTKIRDAIDDASDGDTVFVYNGTYYEHVHIYKSLNLIGENQETTIIDSGGVGGDLVWATVSDVSICFFTIQNSTNWGIYLYRDNYRVFGNIIKDNFDGRADNNILNCLLVLWCNCFYLSEKT